MYAIIRKETGGFYTSPVFGFYDDNPDPLSAEMYYIVLDDKKRKLIRQYEYEQGNIRLNKLVLVTDTDTSGWNMLDEYHGCVPFLDKDKALEYVRDGTPRNILTQCLAYNIEDYPLTISIESQFDIDYVMNATDDFHDAYITSIDSSIPNILVVQFKGLWGCSVEMILENGIKYNAETCEQSLRNCKLEPYWFDASLLIEGKYKYLINEEDRKPEEINESFTWFRAEQMRFRIIPC